MSFWEILTDQSALWGASRRLQYRNTGAKDTSTENMPNEYSWCTSKSVAGSVIVQGLYGVHGDDGVGCATSAMQLSGSISAVIAITEHSTNHGRIPRDTMQPPGKPIPCCLVTYVAFAAALFLIRKPQHPFLQLRRRHDCLSSFQRKEHDSLIDSCPQQLANGRRQRQLD